MARKQTGNQVIPYKPSGEGLIEYLPLPPRAPMPYQQERLVKRDYITAGQIRSIVAVAYIGICAFSITLSVTAADTTFAFFGGLLLGAGTWGFVETWTRAGGI